MCKALAEWCRGGLYEAWYENVRGHLWKYICFQAKTSFDESTRVCGAIAPQLGGNEFTY